MPRQLVNAKQGLKKSKEGQGQMSLRGMLENQAKLQEFSKNEVLQKVAKLIVIDDQVSRSN